MMAEERRPAQPNGQVKCRGRPDTDQQGRVTQTYQSLNKYTSCDRGRAAHTLLFARSHSNTNPGNGRRKFPQVAETNTPRLMDAAGKCLLYHESSRNG